jgi:hypothetical protein
LAAMLSALPRPGIGLQRCGTDTTTRLPAADPVAIDCATARQPTRPLWRQQKGQCQATPFIFKTAGWRTCFPLFSSGTNASDSMPGHARYRSCPCVPLMEHGLPPTRSAALSPGCQLPLLDGQSSVYCRLPVPPRRISPMNEFLQRFTVGKRLFAGFGFLLVLMTVIAISAALSLSSLERHLDTIAVERTTKTRLSNTLYDAANQLYIDLQALLLSQSEAERQEVLEKITSTRAGFVQPTTSCPQCPPVKMASSWWLPLAWHARPRSR